jgi:hypothetical protein
MDGQDECHGYIWQTGSSIQAELLNQTGNTRFMFNQISPSTCHTTAPLLKQISLGKHAASSTKTDEDVGSNYSNILKQNR